MVRICITDTECQKVDHMTLGKVFLTDLEVSEARRGWDGWAKCVRVFGFVSDGRRRRLRRLRSVGFLAFRTDNNWGERGRRLQTERVASLAKYAVNCNLFCTFS